MWFQVDFGNSTTTSGADVAFFANEEQGFNVPESYKVQAREGEAWVDTGEAKYADPVANGITEVEWAEVTSRMVRLVFMPKTGMRVRLVEFKVY
jgi:hypothetical protein